MARYTDFMLSFLLQVFFYCLGQEKSLYSPHAQKTSIHQNRKLKRIDKQCRDAEIGCVECKKIMAANLVKAMAPIHVKRRYYESHPEIVDEIMIEGSAKARQVAKETMAQVKDAVK